MHITLSIIILIVSFNLSAQDTARARWNQQLKQSLNMKDGQYARFIKAGEKYDKQISKIIKDSSLTRDTKMVEIAKVQTERRAVIKQLLSEDQIKKLGELERQRAIAKGSPYYKHKQELEIRMKQRNIERARADSTRRKLSAQ